ncbi:MAG: S8 family peptidase [Bacteroidota bacterium]
MRRILYFLLLCLPAGLLAQVYTETFDAGLNGWTVLGAWEWDADGAADQLGAAVWQNRSRLQSPSGGGVAAFANPETDGQLTSPLINLPAGTTEAYLSFYLYYRSEGGNPRVRLLDGGGTSLFDQTLLTNLGNGQETSAGLFVQLDISGVPGSGVNDFRIEFDVEGSTTFWLLDDVNVTVNALRRPTFPAYLGDSLASFGIPFVVDSTGAAAVPFQLVADFMDGIAEADRATFRNMFKAKKVSTCVCDRIEVWEMPGGLFFDSNGQPLGDPSDILDELLSSGSMNKVDDLDLNYYSYNDLADIAAGPNPPLTADDMSAFSPTPDNALKIAVLDTGVDLDHPDFSGFLFRDADSVGDNVDDDRDCYPDNPLGWNFVDDNNNPNDDNGHGTHVAGIVADNLRPCTNCSAQILPYKTHNNYGVGTLFATTCATLQAAVNDGAKVINASWGFYGGSSDILTAAIDTARLYGATFVAAAGNDSLNMVADPQYPASYAVNNILSVGAADTLPSGTYPLALFSNFGADFVDIAAFGVAVESSILGGTRGFKSGTSMATPAVSAALALVACFQGGDFTGAKDFVLDDPLTGGADLIGKILNQNVLDPDLGCPPPTSTDDEDFIAAGTINVYPNPSFSEIVVEALQNLGPAELVVYSQEGRVISRRQVRNFRQNTVEVFKLNDLPTGQYLVTVSAGGQLITRRLVKR